MKRWAPVLAAIGLLAAACSSGGSSSAQSINPSESHAPVTISMWSEWTSKAETQVFNKVFDMFHEQYPWITVDSRTGLTDNKITAAINAGNPPDSVLSFGVDNVGLWCSTGAWLNLNDDISGADGIDMQATFPAAALTYTSYQGNQCSLPFLTDVTGMYYNKDMFDAAGISDPPKTTDELLEDAKKLTTFDDTGEIKVAGFVPWFGYNCCGMTTLSFGHMFGASWLDGDGNPAFASDPAWAEMFEWQKKFITDVYGDGDFQTGVDKLQRFVAGTADEFSSANDFQIGRVAITLDGEWRAGPNFIGLDAPNLNYGTAPLPTSANASDTYGSGVAGGTVIGIPRGSQHEAEAWLLVRFMATNTDVLTYMANNAYNVPTTNESLQSSDLDFVPQFQTFLDAFNDPHSEYRPTTPIGDGLGTYLDNFADEWQTGKSTDLQGGLQTATDQTTTDLQQSSIP
jgi:multiple sugar transport system substrate-binding protein